MEYIANPYNMYLYVFVSALLVVIIPLLYYTITTAKMLKSSYNDNRKLVEQNIMYLGILLAYPTIATWTIPTTISIFFDIPSKIYQLGKIIGINDYIGLFYAIAIIILFLLYTIIPHFNKKIDEDISQFDEKIDNKRGFISSLIVFLFGLGFYFLFANSTITKLMLSFSFILIALLYVSDAYCILRIKCNIKKLIRIMETVEPNTVKFKNLQIKRHVNKILYQIDNDLPKSLKVNEIYTEFNLKISNKELLRRYLPIYIRYGNENEREDLKFNLEYIASLYSTENLNSPLLIRKTLNRMLNALSNFIVRNEIQVKEDNKLKEFLIRVFGTDSLFVITLLLITSIVVLIIDLVIQIIIDNSHDKLIFAVEYIWNKI
ncbi:MAG: hypothetical protein PWQ75_244 [Methanolobus sp.]|uniref:hypothetical protein n=1 Tax=Methanolobus sp. TaxID=1874737 RepID=UPI00258374AC|nr:hypothetical protein [Methanolobus sp.]MDK2830492.1 hypothetical protein [Methanolobus sp.]